MLNIQTLLVGSILVPLTALILFIVRYIKYQKLYLENRKYHSNSFLFAHLCRSYASVRILLRDIEKSKILGIFFEEKYLNLLELISNRLIYELDQLKSFVDAPDGKVTSRKSFMTQWRDVRMSLYTPGAPEFPPKLYSSFNGDPFGQHMSEIIASRIGELLEKDVMTNLRKHGYWKASEILHNANLMAGKSAATDPLHFGFILNDLHDAIVKRHAQEFEEKTRSAMNKIVSLNIPDASKLDKLNELSCTFILYRIKTEPMEELRNQVLAEISKLEKCVA